MKAKLQSSEVQETTLKDAKVGTCIADALAKWIFPKPSNGKTVTVTYPFDRSPG